MAAALCREFEGLRLKPYLCPAGVPTIGFGSTSYEDGRRVTLQDPEITRERAEELLRDHLMRECLTPLLRISPNLANEAPQRIAALIDFVYNLGAGNYAASTLRKFVDNGDWQGSKTQLMRWTKAGGAELPGLRRRREAEVALITEAEATA